MHTQSIHIYIYMIPVSGFLPPPTPPMWWPCPHYPLLQWLYGGRLVALKVSWPKPNIELHASMFGVWNTFSCRNKKHTPSNLIGSIMIIRVLPIHVPPCYKGGDTLSRLHWNHIWLMMIIWTGPSMLHDAVSPWSFHIYHYEATQGQGSYFPPTRKATIHRGEGGKGVKMGTLHWGGGGGTRE